LERPLYVYSEVYLLNIKHLYFYTWKFFYFNPPTHIIHTCMTILLIQYVQSYGLFVRCFKAMRNILFLCRLQCAAVVQHLSLSLLQAGLNPSGEGSATRVLRLHSALFSTSIRSSRKSSMMYFTTSIHLFLCLPLLRCPCTSASKILLTQPSSSRRCTCPNHLNLASRTLSVMHATPRMRRMSSFFFLSLEVRPRIYLSILISVLCKRSSSRLFIVHVSEP